MEKLTAKEEEVMQVLWKLEEAYVKDMLPYFDNPPLHYNTVSTLVRSLEEKGFVGHRTFGNTHQYYPIIEQKAFLEKVVLKRIVANYFDNSYPELLRFLARTNNISADELRLLLTESGQPG